MYTGPERKTLRLKNFNYSSDGFYFVTICTHGREDYFGEIIEGEMILNEYGKIANDEIIKTEEIRKEIKIDEFVIMPNHLHLVIIIDNNVGNTGPCSLPNSQPLCTQPNTQQIYHKNKLSNAVQRIKSSITLNVRKKLEDFEFSWQKSFFDKIIRNDKQLEKTREYIRNNPLKWNEDINNPLNKIL